MQLQQNPISLFTLKMGKLKSVTSDNRINSASPTYDMNLHPHPTAEKEDLLWEQVQSLKLLSLMDEERHLSLCRAPAAVPFQYPYFVL